jgi:hypothetical protein
VVVKNARCTTREGEHFVPDPPLNPSCARSKGALFWLSRSLSRKKDTARSSNELRTPRRPHALPPLPGGHLVLRAGRGAEDIRRRGDHCQAAEQNGLRVRQHGTVPRRTWLQRQHNPRQDEDQVRLARLFTRVIGDVAQKACRAAHHRLHIRRDAPFHGHPLGLVASRPEGAQQQADPLPEIAQQGARARAPLRRVGAHPKVNCESPATVRRTLPPAGSLAAHTYI